MLFFLVTMVILFIVLLVMCYYSYYYKPVVIVENHVNNHEKAFTRIYKNKLWGTDHPNGFGSLDHYTENDRRALLTIINKYNIKTMLDVPCGTVSWINLVLKESDIDYSGMDIVKEQIIENKKRYPEYKFIHGDMTETRIGKYDLVFSKEGTQHITEKATLRFLDNLKKSGSTYACLTHYEIPQNSDDNAHLTDKIPDLESGAYREQNFLLPPYRDYFDKVLEKFYIRHNIQTHNSQYLILFKI